MNSLFDYGRMVADQRRTAAYKAAMEQVIKPGDRVIDLGCGAGIFSVYAAKLGASEVIGIDPNPAIHYGPSLAKANRVESIVRFYQGVSEDFSPPERADVIVSDLRGALPLFRSHLATLRDAKTRLLTTGGSLLPFKDRIFAAPVSEQRISEMIRNPWTANSLDLNLSLILKIERSRIWRTQLTQENLCCDPKLWATIDYQNIRTLDVEGTLEWTLGKSVNFTGIALWFDAEIAAGIELSNHPALPPCIYAHSLIPVEPIECNAGSTITATINARYIQNQYLWSWKIITINSQGMITSLTESNSSANIIPSAYVERVLN